MVEVVVIIAIGLVANEADGVAKACE